MPIGTMSMRRCIVATLLPFSHGLLVPAPSCLHATQPRHAAPCHPRHAPPCLLQPGDPFPSIEGVPSGTRAVLLVLTGDERRAAEIDAIETIKPELAAMNAVVLTLRNPSGWEAGAADGPCVSYVLDDAGVVVSRCDAADNPTAHVTGALRSVLAMPLCVPQPPPAATGAADDRLSNLEAEVAKLLASQAEAAVPPPPDESVPPPPLEEQAEEGSVPPPPSEAGAEGVNAGATFVAGGAGDIFSQQGATSGSWSAAEEVPEI